MRVVITNLSRFSVFVERMENGADMAEAMMAHSTAECDKPSTQLPEGGVFNVFSWLGLSPSPDGTS